MNLTCHFIATNIDSAIKAELAIHRNEPNRLILEAVPTPDHDELIETLVEDAIFLCEMDDEPSSNLIKSGLDESEIRLAISNMVSFLSVADIYPDSGNIGIEPEEWGSKELI